MIKVINRLVSSGFAKVEFRKATPCELWNKVKDKLTAWLFSHYYGLYQGCALAELWKDASVDDTVYDVMSQLTE